MSRRSTSLPGNATAPASLAADGYAVVRQVLDSDEVSTLRSEVERLLTEAPAEVKVDKRAGTEWLGNLRGLPAFAVCESAPAVRAAVSVLLGAAVECDGLIMRNPRNSAAQQALHVDWAGPVVPGEDQHAQAMFLLDDMRDDNGPLRLVPGTHRAAAVPPRRYSDKQLVHPDQHLINANSGDVIVFSSHTWHGGTANSSGRRRRVITAGFRRVTEH